MCIIIYKQPQINLPTRDILDNCWDSNSDGAGILVRRRNDPNRLLISKGYMNKLDYYKYIDSLNLSEDDFIIYHFRIGTSGGIVPEKTHPFPISTDIEDLNRTGTFYSTSAFIHNGVFGEGTTTLSDTQLYIKDELSQYMKISELDVRKFIITRTAKSCRTITIDLKENFIFTTGEWVKDHNGLYFSNSTYKPRPKFTYSFYYNFLCESDKYYQSTRSSNYKTNAYEGSRFKLPSKKADKPVIKKMKREPVQVTKCNFFK